MTGPRIDTPAGYERFTIGEATVVTLPQAAQGIRIALGKCRTLHGWASTSAGATPFSGRATAWGVTLPGSDTDVVVRHSQHGGVFASLLGDIFFRPGRAARELDSSLRLEAAGVPTPQVVAYVLYDAGMGLCRSDVATRRLPPGSDLPGAWLKSDSSDREEQIEATAELLRSLQRAGAQHPDLNAKNIYLSKETGKWQAYVLDVDRVRFPNAAQSYTSGRNLTRLLRSLCRWRDKNGMAISDDHLSRLSVLAGEAG